MTTRYTQIDATEDGQVTIFNPELKAGLRVVIEYEILPDLTTEQQAERLDELFKEIAARGAIGRLTDEEIIEEVKLYREERRKSLELAERFRLLTEQIGNRPGAEEVTDEVIQEVIDDARRGMAHESE